MSNNNFSYKRTKRPITALEDLEELEQPKKIIKKYRSSNTVKNILADHVYRPNIIIKSYRNIFDKEQFKLTNIELLRLDNIIKQSKIFLILDDNKRFLNLGNMTREFEEKFKELYIVNNDNNIINSNIVYRKGIKMLNIDENIVKQILKKSEYQHLSLKKIVLEYKKIDSNADFSSETLRRFMKKKMGLVYKKPLFKNYRFFTNNTQIIKIMFLKKIIKEILNNQIIIYIDESNFSNRHKSFKKWINKDNNIETSHPGRFASVNLILASTNRRIIHYKIIESTTTSEKFIDFLEELKNEIKYNSKDFTERDLSRYTLYLDNARIHTSLTLSKYFEFQRFNVVFGVPYQPIYNMVERVFGDLKRKFYNNIYFSR
jgi:hypothetical protein